MSDKAKTVFSSAVLFLILLFPNILACFVASDLSSPLKSIAYLIVVCIGLFFPMLFLRRRTYFIVIGALTLFCAPIEIASLYLNHNPATATFVGLFYSTNWEEVIGVLSVVWPLAFCTLIVWVGYFVLASRQPNEWIIPRQVSLWTACIGLPLLLIGALLFFYQYARDINNIQDKKEAITFAKDLILMKFNKIYPYNIYLNTQSVLTNRYNAKRAQKELSTFHFGIEVPEDTMPELYILVIGEAARSENFSLNGYKRETTPRLQHRKNIISYPNMYSQAGTTEESVPHMISRITASNKESLNTEKTLPEAFQEAGFQSIWITNQSRVLCIERTLEAVDQRYETGKDMSTTNNYDEYLLAHLQKSLTNRSEKQFIVLHTMGSHWRYDTRYPESFEQYTPALGRDFTLSMIKPSNRQRLVNAYDNTILYTDYFLDSLISIVEKEHIPALVMYMSDHGENLYDDERNFVLHGNYRVSRWLFHVPLIVWYSDEYASLHSEKIAQVQAHKDSRDNSSVLFESMIDAAGLHYKNDTASDAVMRTRSIFSKNYRAPDTIYVLSSNGACVAFEE